MRAISMVAQQAQKAGTTAAARAQKTWQDEMYDTLVPKGTNPMSRIPGLGSMTPKVNMTALSHDLNKAWLDSKGDPDKATAIIQKQYGAYILKGDATLRGSVGRLVP